MAPDLVGVLRGRQVLIEIIVFHRLMPDKRERLQKTGLTTLEIDLGVFRARQAAREGNARAARIAQRAYLESHYSQASGLVSPSSCSCWRAGFPLSERWQPAQLAFAERHGIDLERAQAVLGSITSRRELPGTTPQELSQLWAQQLGVAAQTSPGTWPRAVICYRRFSR